MIPIRWFYCVLSTDPSSTDSTCQVITETSTDTATTLPPLTPSKQAEADDAETLRRAREEGCVEVVFPGLVTQEGCCRFVSEILKCILYQRQQLPMTYDQLVYSQKRQQAAMQVSAGQWGFQRSRPCFSHYLFNINDCFPNLSFFNSLFHLFSPLSQNELEKVGRDEPWEPPPIQIYSNNKYCLL